MLFKLFDEVSPEMLIKFVSWDQQLQNFEWPHRFLQYRNTPMKSELVAIHLGNIGNEYFECRDWRKAMEMYNQAMCFAENDSNYLGILMAKRGFCFSNMKMYDAGNMDIDFALTLNLPPVSVLEFRRNNDDLKKRTKSYVFEEPKLSFDRDDEYTAMANVLELKFDESNRAFIAAKVDIDVGKTVLLEESFVAIANGYNKTGCATCLNQIRNFMPCRSCTDAVFCSEKCFQQNRIHKLTCGAQYHRMPTPVKFVVQSILKAIDSFPTISFLMQFVHVYIASPSADAAAAKFTVSLDEKCRNYGLFLKQNIQNALSMETAYQAYTTLLSMDWIAERFKSPEMKLFLMHLVGHHTMVLGCNAFGGFETDQDQFISGTMANLVATIEHSCTPNVIHFAYGSREVCITIRPIRAGEHLSYDYNFDANNNNGDMSDSDASGAERKRQLWNRWRIDCQCAKCNGKTESNAEMASDPVFFFASKYKRHFDSRQSTFEQLKQKCMHFLRKFTDVAWNNEMEIITNVYSQCILDEYNQKCSPPAT